MTSYKTYKESPHNYTIEVTEFKDNKATVSVFNDLLAETYNKLVSEIIHSKVEQNKRRL